MIKFEPAKDSSGLPKATAETPEDSVFLAFLRSDIQGDVARCQELIQHINSAKAANHREPIELTGNAYTCCIDNFMFTIESEFEADVAPTAISLETAERTLLAWQQAIS